MIPGVLIPQHAVARLLRCPRCGEELVVDLTYARCSVETCALSLDGAFTLLSGQYSIIDYAASIVTLDEQRLLASSIQRPRKLRRHIINSISARMTGRNRVADQHALLLIEMLRDRNQPMILVVGGGTVGLGALKLYIEQSVTLLSFDIYPSDYTQFMADAHRIPLSDQSIDAVWVQAVLEHVLDPQVVVDEIHRVLKPEGLVYAETPFLQQVHEGPYDFTRFTPSGHRWLFRGFEQIGSGVVAGPATQLRWSIEHLTRALCRSRSAGLLVRGLFGWLAVLDRFCSESYALDSASCTYFFGKRSSTNIPPSAMVALYQGAQGPVKRTRTGSD